MYGVVLRKKQHAKPRATSRVQYMVIDRFLLARCLSCGMRRIGRNDFIHKGAHANFTVNYQL